MFVENHFHLDLLLHALGHYVPPISQFGAKDLEFGVAGLVEDERNLCSIPSCIIFFGLIRAVSVLIQYFIFQHSLVPRVLCLWLPCNFVVFDVGLTQNANSHRSRMLPLLPV